MNTLWQDVRYGFRLMFKQPAFTLVAVITLALGIGANSVIFSAVSAFVLRPLSGAGDPDRLVMPFEVNKNGERDENFSYLDYVEYRDQNQTFDGLATQTMIRAVLGTNEQNDVIWGEIVSGNFFEVLQVRPLIGRTFLPDEDQTPNTHAVVVISHRLWQQRFDARPDIINQTVTLNGRPFTVIGVAPPDFLGTRWGLAMAFWVPMMMQEQIVPGGNRINQRGSSWLNVIGRLKVGVTRAQAAEDMTAIAGRLEEAYPNERSKGTQVIILPEIEGRFSDAANVVSFGSAMAMAAVGFVLLIVCANVANLLLSKALARQREIGIRLALGASRWRLIRQLLTESVMLAIFGGVLGLAMAAWTTDIFSAVVPVLPYSLALNFTPDATVIAFTFGVALVTGIIFGLAPAWQSSKTDVVPVLKGEPITIGQLSRRFTLRNLLVVSQIALSLVVLVCGGLFVKSLQNAKAIDPGFKPDHTMAMTVTPGLLGYEAERGQQFYRQFADRVAHLPGVQSASFVELMPLGDSSNSTGPIVPDGQAVPPPGEGMSAMVNTVAPRYFETLQIPLVSGRDFSEFDRSDTQRVAIINETMAARLWPNENPLGKRFRVARADGAYREVVGIAKDGKYRNLNERPRPMMYLALAQSYETAMTLLVRTTSEDRNLVAGIRQELNALDAKMPLYGIKTMDEHLTYALWGARMGAWLAMLFGSLALLLAAMGIYAVIAFSVSQRTKEIGIRMALGAGRRDVLKLILYQGFKLIGVGVGAGLLIAVGVTRVLSGLLFGVGTFDPIVFGSITILLIGIGLLASYLPARRAVKVDPMVALRYE